MIAVARSRGFLPSGLASTIARLVAQSPNAGSRGRSMHRLDVVGRAE